MKRRDVLAALGGLAAAPGVASAQVLSLPPTPIVPGPGDVLVSLETGLGAIIIALKAQQAPLTTANFLQSFARTLPPMMQVMKDIGGVEVPEYLARFSPENGVSTNGHPPTPPPAT